jgi:hypothetical protein
VVTGTHKHSESLYMTEFKHLGTTLTNKKNVYAEI